MNTDYKNSPNWNQGYADALSQAKDWMEAARFAVDFHVKGDVGFSSGEIASDLRVYRPDLAFSVARLGEYLRDMYAGNEFPSYTDQLGNADYPYQVPRITTGVAVTFCGEHVAGRTPQGTTVFVYDRDATRAAAHNFEVYIPLPPNQIDNPQVLPGPAGTAGSLPALPTSPKQLGVLITGKLAKDDLTATVRQDGRLCVSRAAFEAFVGLTGQPLRAGPNGDSLYVNVEGVPARTVVITLDHQPGSEEYHLWVNRGRLAFVAPAGTTWSPGEKYNVTVESDKITIDVATKL